MGANHSSRVECQERQSMQIQRVRAPTSQELETSIQRNLPLFITHHESQWPNRVWPGNIGSPPDFESLLRLINDLTQIPLNEKELVLEQDASPSAEEVVEQIRRRMETGVLAIVRVGGWVTAWARLIITQIISALPKCSILKFYAIHGGVACQEELVLIYWIMSQLGFQRVETNFNKFQIINGCIFYITAWTLQRSNGSTFEVSLTVNGDVGALTIQQGIAPKLSERCEPNLCQVSIVSCPRGAVQPVNDRLGEEFSAAIARAQQKGFRPEESWRASDEAYQAFVNYFEIRPQRA